jgi:hypothetical protein
LILPWIIKALRFSLVFSGVGRLEDEGLSPSPIRGVRSGDVAMRLQKLLASFNLYVESASLSMELLSSREGRAKTYALSFDGVLVDEVPIYLHA